MPSSAALTRISVTSRLRRFKVNKSRLTSIVAETRTLCGLDTMSVALTFVGPSGIRQLNKIWRGKDRPTDVLAFPLCQWPRPVPIKLRHSRITGSPGAIGSQRRGTRDCDMPLGDIVISLQNALDNAREIGQGLDREVCFLVVHGFLHLCGYDHMNPSDEHRMRRAQRSIMKRLDGPPRCLWQNCVRPLARRRSR